MTKYTINKVFERNFQFPIWKMEVDTVNNLLAVESRNQTDTLPYFSIIDFEGLTHIDHMAAEAKEWTLEGVQGDYLILKRFGDYSPIQAGIQIIHIPSRTVLCTHLEYIIKEVYTEYIVARHRLIPSGIDYLIHIPTGNLMVQHIPLVYCVRDINYPVPYQGQVPKFMQTIDFTDQLWLQPHRDLFLWSYHTIQSSKYALNLSISTKTELLDSKIMLNDLDKLIPQPYFTVKDYIFILSGDKMKISTYLV